MVYFLNFLAVIVYYVIIKICKKRNNKKLFFIILSIHAILFRVLSNPYNYVDTLVYANAFENIATSSLKDTLSSTATYIDWGIGYVLLNWIIGQFSHNPQVMFAIMAVIDILPVMFFYYKNSYNSLLPVVIYLIYPMFYYMGFGVLRQHIAIGFVMLALYYFDNKKLSIGWALLALSFHTSSCVFFPFYVWRRLNREGRNVWKSILLIIVVVVMLKFLMGKILLSMDRYQHYYGVATTENNVVPVAFLGSYLLVVWYTKVHRKLNSTLDTNLLNFIQYGFALAIVGIGTYGMGRMTLCFMYALPPAITLLNKYNRNKPLVALYKIVVLALVVYILIGTYNNHPYAYSFFWENVVRTW